MLERGYELPVIFESVSGTNEEYSDETEAVNGSDRCDALNDGVFGKSVICASCICNTIKSYIFSYHKRYA